MRKRISASLLIIAMTTGCGPILRDVRHPGGYPGYLLDKRTFDASRSKQLQLFRAALIMAMAARMGTATIRDGKDADAFVDYLAAAADEINYAGASLYPVDGQLPCKVKGANPYISPVDGLPTLPPANYVACTGGYYSLFESDVPMMEARISRLMLAALPEERVRSFLQDSAKGNVLSAGLNAIRAVSEAAGGLHRATGVYRTGMEVEAANMTTCKPKSGQPINTLGANTALASKDAIEAQEHSTVWDAVECMGLSHDDLFSSPDEAKGTELGKTVSVSSFDAIMHIARTACKRLQINTDMEPMDPKLTASEIAGRVTVRDDQCRHIVFRPQARPGSELH